MLQERFGIGYHEAYKVRPAWEIRNLMDHHNAEIVAAVQQHDRQQIEDAHAEKLKRLGIEQ